MTSVTDLKIECNHTCHRCRVESDHTCCQKLHKAQGHTLNVLLCMPQVFVALLRISQPDGRRAIIRQALDVLTPALVRRLPQGENRYPIWIRWGLTSVLCQPEVPPCSD